MSDDDLIRRGYALAAVREWTYCCDAEATIAALPAVTVGVKPLVWRETNDGNHRKGECFSTRSPVSFAPIAAHKKHDGWWLNVDCKTYPTLEAAKAAAQADYTARILAALGAVTVGLPTEEQIASACMSYDHSFGLMDGPQRVALMHQAHEWLYAWQKELAALRGIGGGDG